MVTCNTCHMMTCPDGKVFSRYQNLSHLITFLELMLSKTKLHLDVL